MSVDRVDLEGPVFLVSSIPCHAHLPPFLQDSLSSEGTDLMETLRFSPSVPGLSLCPVFGCGSLYFSPSAAVGKLLMVAEHGLEVLICPKQPSACSLVAV